MEQSLIFFSGLLLIIGGTCFLLYILKSEFIDKKRSKKTIYLIMGILFGILMIYNGILLIN